MIIFRIQFISIRVNRICVTKGVQLSLVRPTKACFRWIPSNCWIFHHSSSFLMTLGPSSSAFVSFLSYRWLFNVATSFVNGPLTPYCRWVDISTWTPTPHGCLYLGPSPSDLDNSFFAESVLTSYNFLASEQIIFNLEHGHLLDNFLSIIYYLFSAGES